MARLSELSPEKLFESHHICLNRPKIQEGQLTILAERLSEVEENLEKLEASRALIRSEALKLMQERKSDEPFNSQYGKFTICSGKKTKVFTCSKVKKAQTTLDNAKRKATENGQFETKQGDDFLRFDSVPLN